MEWILIAAILIAAAVFCQRLRCQRKDLEAKMLEVSRRDAQEIARLVTFPEENPHIVMEINIQGAITYVNPACRGRFPVECTDCSHPLLSGLEEKLVNFDQNKWRDFEDEVAIDSCVFNRRIKYIAESGQVRIYGFDITHLKEVEQALDAARKEADEASSLKSIFLANMSHEIRTPLNAIIGYTDLMMMDTEKSSERERLGIINRSGKNLLELINDILDLSKIEAGKLDVLQEEFSFCQAIDHIRQLFSAQAADKKLDFRVSCPGILPESVIGDVKRITQVIVNLLTNSFKFTEAGSVSLSCAYENGTAIMMVADTGIGISEEQQQAIFTEFQQGDANTTRKYGGTGLGLSITRRLVDLMGGTIFLASEEGKGSTFTVRLPLPAGASFDVAAKSGAAEQAMSSGTMMSALARVSSGLQVLLAEDDMFNQGLIRQMLKKINVDLVTADNGQEALGRLQEADFDLLLLDMQMPVLDGMQTIEQIRKNNAWNTLHVIALTGETQDGDAEKFMNAGCNDYMAKPMNLEEFYGKIYALLAGQFSEDDNGLFSGESENVSAGEGEEHLVLTPELRVLLNDIITGLKNNMKIFNPDQIHSFAASLDEFDSDSRMVLLQKELQQVASTFDDEALPSIVRQLESL